MDLPLNALRAFEVSARHLSFTRAAQELHLTQTAVSQHVKNLEQRLGKPLFRRVPRGLALTDEGMALLPTLVDAFARVSATLESFKGAPKREVLSVGAVGTFAVGWLLPRLRDFQARHPFVELRLFTHNNRIDLAAEGLDCAIDLLDRPFVGLPVESGLSRLLHDQALQHGRGLHHRVRVRGLDAVMQLVGEGVGVAVVPRATALRLAHERVVVRPLSDAWATRRLLLCTAGDAAPGAGAAALHAFLALQSTV